MLLQRTHVRLLYTGPNTFQAWVSILIPSTIYNAHPPTLADSICW